MPNLRLEQTVSPTPKVPIVLDRNQEMHLEIYNSLKNIFERINGKPAVFFFKKKTGGKNPEYQLCLGADLVKKLGFKKNSASFDCPLGAYQKVIEHLPYSTEEKFLFEIALFLKFLFKKVAKASEKTFSFVFELKEENGSIMYCLNIPQELAEKIRLPQTIENRDPWQIHTKISSHLANFV